jgi:hypothetical protein
MVPSSSNSCPQISLLARVLNYAGSCAGTHRRRSGYLNIDADQQGSSLLTGARGMLDAEFVTPYVLGITPSFHRSVAEVTQTTGARAWLID